jgi:hypothetical protein
MNYLWINLFFTKIALVWKTITNPEKTRMIRQLFRSRAKEFQVRSTERDATTDQELVASIAAAIDLVLEKTEAERAGLKSRLEDVISRAAIVGGNDTEDYLTRTDDRSKMLSESDAEIRRGQARLAVIERNISHFKFLRTALQTRFPDSKI